MVFNIPCVRLMSDDGYIQLRERSDQSTEFYIVPCKVHDIGAIPWRANCGERIYPREYKDYGGYFYEQAAYFMQQGAD
jgi:hypothetical protein